MIKAIVAAGANWEIGKSNGLLFKLPADMRMFKELTEHTFVVCGANTLRSFPDSKPLKNRTTLVLCKKYKKFDDCLVYHDFKRLVNDIKIIAKEYDVYVIGGGQMYKSLLPYCDEVIVNKVYQTDTEATVFFPNMDNEKDFELVIKGGYIQDGNYLTQLYTYRKKI